MKSFVTSYNGLFAHHSPDAPTVERIEVPLIQRDYAQGRRGETVVRIRRRFLEVLHQAATGGEPVSLDFVYGDVVEGTLRPLDGQQRLTTLFLLHWYLASGADRLGQEQGWKRFTYATRASARLFCERLVESRFPAGVECLSRWIEDHPWYQYTWCHDPTIQSMLVVLDDLHHLFCEDDCLAAWDRLLDAPAPAISFHLLPIEQLGLSEDLYIKMNSRGKPLTPFENFKAHFEQMLKVSCPSRVEAFSLRVDGEWSDLLWPYRGSDDIVDDEFLRYFRFVTEIGEWRQGRQAEGEIGALAERVYGPENPDAAASLDFLFQAFDTWRGVDIAAVFDELLATAPAPGSTGDLARVVLFGLKEPDGVNLFASCCRNYGEMSGPKRDFSLLHTLLLYAILLHRLHQTADFPLRLRVLRNLLEASGDELRLERMPALIADVRRLVIDGALESVSTFNQGQVADERAKAALLALHPGLRLPLFQLEDHPVLRGCLAAFELDATVFEQRAGAFLGIFQDSAGRSALTGALLAMGDYSRRQANGRYFQLGAAENLSPWRELLAGSGRAELRPTRVVLGELLDEVAQTSRDVGAALVAIQQRWLLACEQNKTFGWRYYFVKYPAMREGWSGLYVGKDRKLGYSVCMLNGVRVRGKYRDPYLLAILRVSGVGGAVQDPWFTGYESEERWMRLKRSGAEIRCVEEGLALRPPQAADHARVFSRIGKKHGVGDESLLAVPQVELDGQHVDTRDRVELGAALLRDLVAEGL